MYVPPERARYFVFDRTYPFSEDERLFIENIACAVHDKSPEAHDAVDATVAAGVTQTIARYVAPEFSQTVQKAVHVYDAWAENGDRTAHTLGIRPMRTNKDAADFFALAEKGLIKALGASRDTLVVIDDAGGIYGVEKIPAIAAGNRRRQDIFAPVAYADIAAWANSRRKVALRLTEDGSILLFSKGSLLFVKHRAYWYSLPHTLVQLDPIPESIEGVLPETVKAVYLTALDMAGGNDKARIGLVRCDGANRPPSLLRKMGICLSAGDSSNNARLLAAITNSRKFHEIPRTIRAEICALGGTLLLDGQGNMLGLDTSGSDSNMAALLFSSGGSTGRVFPGSAYMEFFNRDGRLNLRLAIR